jgi:hypothetical protein
MRAAIEEDFAKIPGLLDVLRLQADPASESAQNREAVPSSVSTQANQERSLWDMLAPADPGGPEQTGGLSAEDEIERPDGPLPGQQRLF